MPVEVDATSGYRHYAEQQIADGVLVGLLRRLDMPLHLIATVLHADAAERASAVRTYWESIEAASAERRNVMTYLCSLLEGTTMTTHDVMLRSLPERRLASLNRHVLAGNADAFFNEAFPALHAAGAGLEGIAGCPFLVFYGEVSKDSDGPIELCRPIAARGPVAVDGVETRYEAAHDEMYVRLSKAELAWPAMRAALDDLEAWARENNREPGATFRQVLIADQRTATPGTHVCDLSVPLR